MIVEEVMCARTAFSPWLKRLQTDIDDVFCLGLDSLRRHQAENFLRTLQATNIRLDDFEAVVSHVPTGGPFGRGDVLLSTRDLLDRLSEDEKTQLKRYLDSRIEDLAREYPDLKSKFYNQFVS
jgi:hypothetical protein